MLKKILKVIRRRLSANKLGIKYTRAANWKLPKEILIGGKNISLSAPDDTGSRIAFLDIFLDDVYGLKKIKPLEVKTILDIGAHVGFFSLFARTRFPHAVIHAYEPNPLIHSHTRHQSSAGDFDFFPYAVGLEKGKTDLSFSSDSVQTKTVNKGNGTIEKLSFQEVIEKLGNRVDILKLDCEGEEWNLFKEKMSVWERVKYLCMEYHLTEAHSREDVVSIVSSLKFHIIKHEITGDTWGLIHAYRK